MASDQPGEIQDCYESRPAQRPGHGGRFYPLDVFHCLVFLRRTDASGRFSPGEAKNIASTVTAHFDKGSSGQEETRRLSLSATFEVEMNGKAVIRRVHNDLLDQFIIGNVGRVDRRTYVT